MEINKIYNEDCLEGMKRIDDKSIDMICCDLPYGTTACSWDIIIPFDELWTQYERIIKHKRNIVLFSTGIFTYKLVLSNLKKFRYELIWKKSKCGSPFTAKYMPMKKHENILVFGDNASLYNPQMIKGKPYKRKYTTNKVNNHKYGIVGTQIDNKCTRYPDSILDFPQKWRRQDQLHPTQKPVELIEYLIKTYSNEGDLILDNCMGSGTTAIACMNTNRNFIWFELNKDYYDIACKRIKEEQQQLKLFS